MTQYDPEVIQQLANKLYQKANTVVFVYSVLGAIVGGVGGFTASQTRDRQSYAIAGAIVIGLLGLAIGLSRSFMLRVQAQTALCQRQIEVNTRRV